MHDKKYAIGRSRLALELNIFTFLLKSCYDQRDKMEVIVSVRKIAELHLIILPEGIT